ncbi:hypothetical protein [Micromonospora sp. NPDC005652]
MSEPTSKGEICGARRHAEPARMCPQRPGHQGPHDQDGRPWTERPVYGDG